MNRGKLSEIKQVIMIMIIVIIFSNLKFTDLNALEKFYNYYDNGLEYMEKGDWLRAIEEFKSASSLEFEDAKKKRT